ncbi:8-amino-3,8-dideoxy-manno-octulosonate cytidylyltransferase [Thiomicrorhabdus immobilis]|uniref:3-deoxy-manno-octulosonate cytidylyltransferase n=1 Tax=Thiomicrorhabdus immobilis TaxID=2791037 RepID=A0ABM7MG12_9GAMM|nr:3-deoxy-manno-octulosonate cytidylyltransferase [Thiomicrorhabdus immobilis]BCN94418.1 8-amino-3,8-dideoxy-manno-octulosonate cytidylyltransferase [Thiomicrorhabdus immobilis]
MNTYVFIPARYGSSRLPGKPLKLIDGKPMIQHVYERISKAQGLAGVYIATDDDRIKEVAEAFGGKVVMTPVEAASGTDRIAAAANALGLQDEDLIVNVQGDQPLVHHESIEDVIAPFLAPDYDKSFEMSTLSFKIVNESEITNPKDVKLVTDVNGFALYFSRATIPHGRDYWDHDSFKHLGVYAYTKRFVDTFNALPMGRLEDIEKLEQLRALEFGHKIKVVQSQYDSPEVDLPGDIAIMEALLQAGH